MTDKIIEPFPKNLMAVLKLTYNRTHDYHLIVFHNLICHFLVLPSYFKNFFPSCNTIVWIFSPDRSLSYRPFHHLSSSPPKKQFFLQFHSTYTENHNFSNNFVHCTHKKIMLYYDVRSKNSTISACPAEL